MKKEKNWQEKVYDSVVDWKPMSQVVHWTLILWMSCLPALQITQASLAVANM